MKEKIAQNGKKLQQVKRQVADRSVSEHVKAKKTYSWTGKHLAANVIDI